VINVMAIFKRRGCLPPICRAVRPACSHRPRPGVTAAAGGVRDAFLGSLAVAGIFAFWLAGAPVALPGAPGGRIACLSYTPFRGEDAVRPSLVIPGTQIEEDLTRLKTETGGAHLCVNQGLDQVVPIAERLGLKC
jgi:hypothetical protein